MSLSNEELACVYAALILQDDDVAITGEKIATILKAANVEVEPFWPGLFAKALEGANVKDLITALGTVGGGGGGGAAPAAAAAGGAAPAAEEKKEEKKKEESEDEDEDMGFGLFD